MNSAESNRPGLLRSAGIISAAVATSRFTGVIRESVLGWMFGAGAAFDAYVLGYRIPSLARELFAEGALSSAFIPTFTRYLETKTPEETRELSNITATMLMIITGLACALGIVFSPWIVNLFAPGFHAIPGKWELAVRLVRTMFPFLFFLALSAQAQGMLYATRQFGIPAVSSSLFNVASVLSGVLLGFWLGPLLGLSKIEGMAIGVVIGGAAQLAFQLPSIWRAGFAWQPRWDLRRNLQHEGVRHILSLMGPAVIGSASGQINILVNTNLAAGLLDAAGHAMNGPVSWLSYAYRFFSLPMGVFGVAVSSAALPRLSSSVAHEDFAAFRETLSHSISLILLLTIPSAVGLAILGESMIGLVFQHGKFLANDTVQTALALQCYAVGLAGYSCLKLIAPAFYALGDARTPMRVSLVSVFVNGVTAFTMVRVAGFGHAGLALSSSVVSIFSSLTLLMLLRSRIGGVRGWELSVNLVKICCAAAAMGFVCFAVVRVSHANLSGSAARLTDIIAGVPAGAASFYAIASALRIPELKEARESVQRRFRTHS